MIRNCGKDLDWLHSFDIGETDLNESSTHLWGFVGAEICEGRILEVLVVERSYLVEKGR